MKAKSVAAGIEAREHEVAESDKNQASPEVRRELELHLSQCRACHVLYDSSCKTVKIVTESSSFELPQIVSDPIIDRVMASCERTVANEVKIHYKREVIHNPVL